MSDRRTDRAAPCPWCASPLAVATSVAFTRWFVACYGRGCYAQGPVRSTKAAALAAWDMVAPRTESTVPEREVRNG